MLTQSLLHVENIVVTCDCRTPASDTVGVRVCILQQACTQFCFIHMYVLHICKDWIQTG